MAIYNRVLAVKRRLSKLVVTVEEMCSHIGVQLTPADNNTLTLALRSAGERLHDDLRSLLRGTGRSRSEIADEFAHSVDSVELNVRNNLQRAGSSARAASTRISKAVTNLNQRFNSIRKEVDSILVAAFSFASRPRPHSRSEIFARLRTVRDQLTNAAVTVTEMSSHSVYLLTPAVADTWRHALTNAGGRVQSAVTSFLEGDTGRTPQDILDEFSRNVDPVERNMVAHSRRIGRIVGNIRNKIIDYNSINESFNAIRRQVDSILEDASNLVASERSGSGSGSGQRRS